MAKLVLSTRDLGSIASARYYRSKQRRMMLSWLVALVIIVAISLAGKSIPTVVWNIAGLIAVLLLALPFVELMVNSGKYVKTKLAEWTHDGIDIEAPKT